MQNIITSNLSLKELAEILEQAGKPPLLPAYGSQKWRDITHEEAIQDWKTAFREEAASDLGRAFPELTDDLYAHFSGTGERLPFEKIYFQRRLILGRIAICALLFPEESRWINGLVPRFRSILEEESWALPAHIENASGKDPLFIDLFCAETANFLGELLTVFGDLIPASLRTQAVARIRKDVVDNFLERHEEFWWTKSRINWNAVCHQGVLGAAFAVEDDNTKIARLLQIAGANLKNFLSGFGKDGGCSEGPGYWEYGFGWFAVLNEQIETRSGRQLSLFEGDEHVRTVATYGYRVTLEGGRAVNFADSADSPLRPQLLQYLGERLGDENNIRLAAVTYGQMLRQRPDFEYPRFDFFNLSRFFLYCPPNLDFEVAPVLEDTYFDELQVLIAHGLDKENRRWSLAAKGGHNAEHHNHNDCGSYVVQVNGVMLIREIGSPEYNRDFFGPLRYEHLAARSLGHSVPLVNGCEQAQGGEYVAHVEGHGINSGTAFFNLDLTDCYPEAARLKRLTRHIRFDKAAGVITIEDSFDLNEVSPVETAILTDAEVQTAEWGIQLKKEDQILFIIPDRRSTRIGEVQSHTFRDHDGNETLIHRIVLTPPEPKTRLTLKYRITTDADKA